MGVSFTEYLKMIRLQHALRLLEQHLTILLKMQEKDEKSPLFP